MKVKRIRNKLMESKNAEEKAEELEDNYSSVTTYEKHRHENQCFGVGSRR
jgi:hypothetical protein